MADDIMTRLHEMLDGSVPFVIGREDIRDAANEINRLRDLVHRWKNAAEAYERGSIGNGHRLIKYARNQTDGQRWV